MEALAASDLAINIHPRPSFVPSLGLWVCTTTFLYAAMFCRLFIRASSQCSLRVASTHAHNVIAEGKVLNGVSIELFGFGVDLGVLSGSILGALGCGWSWISKFEFLVMFGCL
ncbi:hypothetical protein AMTR_s00146p00064510 [Amborella trichopoda]|uniref:Uncharacterized protein n=1 Tax=Amborella trichopoda TaxID=13333 RepID=W1PAX7_AMBTC|nr:hypothetical protein AMTR_s00146p00064510 [Amborella trichopoda]